MDLFIDVVALEQICAHCLPKHDLGWVKCMLWKVYQGNLLKRVATESLFQKYLVLDFVKMDTCILYFVEKYRPTSKGIPNFLAIN